MSAAFAASIPVGLSSKTRQSSAANSDAPRCFEERIREWLAALIVFRTDHRIEHIKNANGHQCRFNRLTMPSRGDGQRFYAAHAHGDLKHRQDGLGVADTFKIVGFLAPHRLVHVAAKGQISR